MTRDENWRRYGHRVDPAWTCRQLMAELDLKKGVARELLADVRRRGKPSEAGEAEEPAPTERGTVVEDRGDTIEARHTDTEINARIMNVDDLVEVAQIDLTQWEIASHKVNTWSTVTKNDDGTPTVTRLWQVSATLRPRVVPLVALDWPPPPVFVCPAELSEPGQVRRALVLPDAQIGFRWRGLDEGTPWLEPYHDRRAIDLALQILARVQPDHVVILGDMLDLQELSTRWAFGDDARRTTPLAIREWAWLLWRIREICPSAPITYMLGNHEARLEKFLEERAGGLAGIRHHDGRRALGLRDILGLDALQVETHRYPDPYWLWGRVEVEHGRTVRAGGGSTAADIVRRREHSVVYGHIHRAELAQRTVETPKGPRHTFAASPGCLCHTDGRVPGSDRPDWQQGVGLITLLDGADEEIQLVRFAKGRAVWDGQVLVGRDYTAELVAATGAAALAQPEAARRAA